ncbi:hypothetical protein AVEN_265824-1 [Araneus ventricosus]|uniref:Uncharacterized protein n=1 Tax=Araneus ventricosus TaxID=182803 RepID=A0A4Y2DZN8_ARAVE|nr:hypothetical protein AVEN_265824-1 [Araneus ventricosus]
MLPGKFFKLKKTSAASLSAKQENADPDILEAEAAVQDTAEIGEIDLIPGKEDEGLLKIQAVEHFKMLITFDYL